MMSLPLSSSSTSRKKYDVFLSFRGEDTRTNFTDHLYDALKRRGIVTFRDDPKLEAGEEIGPELFKAIQQSWCSVIVFSKTYASSSWCLEELAEIVKQRKEQGLKVFPIFYDLDPSDLRKQKGKVAEAFAKHEERYEEDNEKVQKWRNALSEVAGFKGWHLRNQHESEFIRDIVKEISKKLCQTYPIVHEELVGISSRLKELYSKIEIGGDDVRIIGICGMGGIGKTTLARVVYDQMAPRFEGKSFIADVREVSDKCGLVSLQKQLLSQILFDESFNIFNVYGGNAIISHRLSHKKVLVILDDVDNLQHLKCLVGSRDWFGIGSRIIVTTRDEQLLRSYPVDDVYTPTTLDDNDALELFNSKAFDGDTIPKSDFIHLSKQVVRYAGGLPLALEVLGSFLRDKDTTDQWRSAIERLERDSNKDILDRLRISFDGLEENEKNIFLDIACFFNGEEKDFVMKLLDGCEFFPDIGIDVLVKKSLVTVKYNKLGMHDLLKEMGRKIVTDKCSNEPGKCCRLWEERDVHHVLTKNTATDVIEGLVIDNKRESNKILTLSADAFSRMKRLRLLKVLCFLHCDELKYLSNEIRLLDWMGYPLRTLPSSFEPDNLVVLLLTYSRIEQLWKGTKHMYKLKLINLTGSRNLIKTPDLTMAPNLEKLILEGCTRLVDVHPSVGVLKKLKLLNLKGCKSLRTLPTKIEMESLERLTLSGCSNLERFPEIDGKMERLLELNLSGCYKIENLPESLQKAELLEKLDLSETAITKPPSFVSQLKYLKVLNFSGRKRPSSSKLRQILPSLFFGKTNSMALVLPSLSGLSSLTELNLSDCNLGEGDIPSDISCLSSLKFLDLSGNNFISIPSSFARLSKLDHLDLSDCRELISLPELLTSTKKLSTNGCVSLELIANPSKVCKSTDWASFRGAHCYRLAEKMNALTFLRKHLKAFENSREQFSMVLPGSEIPEWFTHQMVGSRLRIRLPLDIRDDNKWRGVAFCCIFVNQDVSTDKEYFNYKVDIYPGNSDYDDSLRDGGGFVFNKPSMKEDILKDHIFLRYLSRDMLYPNFLENKCGGLEIDDLSTSNCSDQEWEELELILGTGKGYVKVKQCGIRIVYQQDLEDIQPMDEQYHNQGYAESEDINEDGSISNTSLVKRKRNVSEDDAEAEPQPKRMENIFNFIMGQPGKKP